jgi:uncharacterized protein (DUF362 family)
LIKPRVRPSVTVVVVVASRSIVAVDVVVVRMLE